jgi:hypothetical protein
MYYAKRAVVSAVIVYVALYVWPDETRARQADPPAFPSLPEQF